MVEKEISLHITSLVEDKPKENGNLDAMEMGNPVPAEIFNSALQEGERSFRRTPQMRRIESQHNGRPIEEILDDYYWVQNKSTRQIGKQLGPSAVTIGRWFVDLELEIRSPKDGFLVWYVQRQPREISAVKSSPTKNKLTQVKEAFGIKSEEESKTFLRITYKKHYSLRAMARALGERGINVSSTTVENWMSQFELDINVLRQEDNKNLVKRSVESGDLQRLTEEQRDVLKSRGFFREGRLTPFRNLPEVQSKAMAYQLACKNEIAALRKLKAARLKKAQADALRSPIGRPRKKMDSDLIVDLYSNKGLSAPVIAEMFECGATTITNRLRMRGTEIRPPGRYYKQK